MVLARKPCRFFRFLGKHIVNDHIHLHIKLHADLQP
jgi:hypothetical protein